jgi:uncharacterized protein YfaS (alpha-2-macroglobulin family)
VSGLSNSDGVALLPAPPGHGPLLVQRGSDLAAIGTDAESPDGRLVTHFQTDRPIYRPGQGLGYKAILRLTHGQGYEPVLGRKVKVELRDPKDNAIDEQEVEPTRFGTISGSFDLPAEGMLGNYSLVAHVGGQQAYDSIEVQEYRKPEYEVSLRPEKKRALSGEKLRFKLNAKYYFGSPVPQAQVRWTARRNPLWVDLPGGGYRDGNLYPSDTFATRPFAGEGATATDNDGNVTIELNSEEMAPDSEYSVTVTVTDPSQRQVTASADVPVYAAQVRLGLSTNVVYAPLGTNVPVVVRAVDLDGHPVGTKVYLRVLKLEWNEKKQRFEGRQLADLLTTLPATGKATVKLPAKAEGDLIIEATADDGSGRKTRTRLGVYFTGFGSKTVKDEQPIVMTRVDRRSYKPGDVGHASIETNNLRAPVLVALEGQDVWAYSVIRSAKRQQEWAFSLAARHSPTVFVTAATWAKTGLLQSNVPVPVPDESRRLKLSVEPDKREYRPGDPATMTVRVTDQEGRPAVAEMALSVVDEAIYALREDGTQAPYDFYWGQRGNQVGSFMSAPEELSAGAYQRGREMAKAIPAGWNGLGGLAAAPVVPVRKRFEDTAFWSGTVETDETGTGKVSFEMPGNLTTWRSIARGIDLATRGGEGSARVVATRPLTLRLSTPRQMVPGDRLTLTGTVNCRLKRDLACRVSIRGDGVSISGESVQEVLVPAASGQATVKWDLAVSAYPPGGKAVLHAEVVPVDPASAGPDAADALEVSVPIAPNGVAQSSLFGGTVERATDTTLDLPKDLIAGTAKVRIEVGLGNKAALAEAADEVLRAGRYGSLAAADQLEVAAALGLPARSDAVRESFALLSRVETSMGWGWWDDAPAEPSISAKVLEALWRLREAKVADYGSMILRAQGACERLYQRSPLWEEKALLAAALTLTGYKDASLQLEDVVARGIHLSPFSRLKMAEALAVTGQRDEGLALFEKALADASVGPADAYFPTGYGLGWTADSTETTAQALSTAIALGGRDELAAKLARWLAPARDWWMTTDSNAAKARAFAAYLKKHPEPVELGAVSLWLNGQPLEVTPVKLQPAVVAMVPAALVRAGGNQLRIERLGPGEARYTVRAVCFVPAFDESLHGVRALRRYEARSAAGVWTEVAGPVKAGQPVRCTVMVWGDELSDALKVTEPIPAGFEFISGDRWRYSREEVRDAAVIHYVPNSGRPVSFVYYLRPESAGRLRALPARAEYLRRPAVSGQTGVETLRVEP